MKFTVEQIAGILEGDIVGNPSVDGASVEAKLLDNVKDRTVLIFHKRRRKHSRKKNGHRQRHSKIQITKIMSKGGKVIDEAKVTAAKKEIKPSVVRPTSGKLSQLIVAVSQASMGLSIGTILLKFSAASMVPR